MSTIIRATDQNRGIQPEAFNFEDLTVRGNRYLEKIRVQAAQLVAAAHRDADAIRKRAEAEGRAAGRRAVDETVARELGQQLATLLPALRGAIGQVRDAKQAWMQRWEQGAIHLAAAIAARVVRRELAQRPEIALDWLRESLELAAGSGQLRIHLHPADCQTLGAEVQTLVKEMASAAAAEVVPDAAISPGGCRVETRFGSIDQQLETQLARIEEELT